MNSKPDSDSTHLKNQLFDLYDKSSTSIPDEEIIHPLFSELKKVHQDYKIIDIIAKGGMKTIYKALHLKSQRKVAMAKLHDDTPEELYDPFIREARLAALLDHPNIIKVYDLGVDESNRPFFTMELKTGTTLEDMIKQKSLSIQQRLNLFLKVCDAIAYAHSKSILHLDIKPSNIQVGSFGELLICDWGLGRILNDELDEIHNELLHPDLLNHMTMGSEIKGTPGYMAPEQVNCEEKTTATDIYSLGVLLRTMMTGKPPEGDSIEELLDKTRLGSWELPSNINPLCPKTLDGIIKKAMAISPKQRYSSAADLHKDVEKVLLHFSPSTEQGSLLNELSLFYKRHALICQVSFAFTLLIILLSLHFTRQLKISRDLAISQRNEAELNEKKAKDLSHKLELEKAQVKAISLDLINTHLKRSAQFSDEIIFDNPISAVALGLKTLDKIHTLSPEQEWAFMQKGYLHMVKLDFVSAFENLECNQTEAPDLYKLSELYSQKYPKVNHENSLKCLSDLIDDFFIEGKRFILLDKMLSYEVALNGYRDELEEIVKKSLQAINPDWDVSFKYDHGRQQLTLGNNLKELVAKYGRYNQSAIRHLPIKKLKFTSKKFKNVHQLMGLNYLETLDLSQLKDLSLLGLPKLPQLKTIILNQNHPYYDLEGIHRNVDLIYQ